MGPSPLYKTYIDRSIDRVVAVLLGVFCLIGSYYFYTITLQHQEQVKTTVETQSAQIEAVKTVAAKVEHTVKQVKAKDLLDCNTRLAETDRRQQADRRDINLIKKRLGIP